MVYLLLLYIHWRPFFHLHKSLIVAIMADEHDSGIQIIIKKTPNPLMQILYSAVACFLYL